MFFKHFRMVGFQLKCGVFLRLFVGFCFSWKMPNSFKLVTLYVNKAIHFEKINVGKIVIYWIVFSVLLERCITVLGLLLVCSFHKIRKRNLGMCQWLCRLLKLFLWQNKCNKNYYSSIRVWLVFLEIGYSFSFTGKYSRFQKRGSERI